MTAVLITPPPSPPPSRNDPANFAERGDAHVAWQETAVAQMNAQCEQNNTLHEEVITARDELVAAGLATAGAHALAAAQAAEDAQAALADIQTNWQDKLDAAYQSATDSGLSAALAQASAATATAQAGLSAAAKTAAELARDAALVGAGVYATEAAGRAAVADGAAFKVQGSGDVAAFEYRRTNSATSVLIATYPSSTSVANMKTAFEFTPPKNKYDPSLAVDGQLYSYTTGVEAAYATGINSGRIPVSEGVTYTLSQPSPEKGFLGVVHCWNSAGAFLGLDRLISSNPVVSGLGLITRESGGTGGFRQMTFTIPVGSGVAFVGFGLLYGYAAHTTDDFNRIRSAVQLEVGAAATSFEAYTTVSQATVREEKIPQSIQRVGTVLPAIIDSVTFAPGKNLYNKALAVDGMITGYATGANTANASGMAFGKTPVVAGFTYTASMSASLGFDSQHVIYCYNAAGVFLGIDHTVGATAGMASPPTGVTWVGDNQVTFTIPSGSSIAYVGFMGNYSTHTASDFNAVVSTIQIEVGTSATSYERYAPLGMVYQKDTAPEITDLQASVATLLSNSRTPFLSVQKSGSDIYISCPFDSTTNLIQKITLSTGVAFTNDTINAQGAKSALRAESDLVKAWVSGTSLHASGDDSAPLVYNYTYIGANHGAAFVREVSATAHGKSVQDVGSEWVDGAGVKWYLMRVVDVNKLWLISQNNATYPAWSFTTSISGSTLTHSSGATNTGAINVASSIVAQLYPAVKNQIKTVLLDGTTPLTADGTYRCDTLHIIENYDICNPAAVVAYVRGLVGSATQPAFNHSSIAADVRRTLTYVYAENGSCSITDGVQALNNLTMGYLGATQAMPLTYTGKQLWQYIPRVNSITNGSGVWNFSAQARIDGSFEQVNLLAANWSDANRPPDRMAQIVKTSGGVSEYGLMVGYSPRRGVGIPALRKTLVNDACFLSASRKQYPKAVNIGPLNAGTCYDITAFRAYWPASAASAATTFVWYRDGTSVIVVADYHQNVSASPLVLPAKFTGMDVDVIDKTDSLTLHGNGVVSAGGLVVSVAGGYGYGVFRLS